MISTKPASMHSEHRYWENEISLWRDDLCAWQHELAKSENEIQNLETALANHGAALRTHASALRLEEQASEQHEHAIVEFEKGGEGDLFEMARKHSYVSAEHQKDRAAHEQLKRRHHGIIAHWNALLKALCEVGGETLFHATTMPHRELD